jgi:hypothetical protein
MSHRKGRIENNGNQKGSKETSEEGSKEGREEEVSDQQATPKGDASASPLVFLLVTVFLRTMRGPRSADRSRAVLHSHPSLNSPPNTVPLKL